MEREREHDPEAIQKTFYENAIKLRGQWVEKQMKGQVLVKGKEREYQQGRQGRLKYYLHPINHPETAVDNWIMFAHDIRRQSGRHRHQGGLILYVIEGEGYTEVDGQILDWRAGDLLLLPIQPNGVAHKHFNKDSSKGCRWMAFIYTPMMNYTVHYLEQLEESPDLKGGVESVEKVIKKGKYDLNWKARVSGDQVPLVTHPDELETTNLFDRLLEMRDHQRERQKTATWLIRGDDLPWELNQHGKMQWYLHPCIEYSTIKTNMFYKQEIPVGSRSGTQRHGGDKVFLILQGKGYTEIDGVKYEWEGEDVVTLPLRPDGVTYRHVNTGDVPVILVACEPNFVHTVDIDRGAGFEELAPCPEYRQQASKRQS